MTSVHLPLDSAAREVALLGAEFPITLLPVRIETRFGTRDGRPCLRVRVYPDELAAGGHEPELTADEVAAGTAYWTNSWTGGTAGEQEAWRALLVRYSSARAAWIVLQTTPTNLANRPAATPAFPTVAQKAGSWTQPVSTRVLPDHWFVVCFRGGVAVHRAIGGPIADPLVLTVSPAIDPEDTTNLEDISGDGLLLDKALLWTVQFSEAEAVGMGVTVDLDASELTSGFDRVLVYGVKASLGPAESAARLQSLLDAHHYNRGLAMVAQGTPTNNTVDAAAGFPPKDPNGAASFAVERGSALAVDGSAGLAMTRALGVATSTADHLAGAERAEQQWAEAMNCTTWPLTWGYFLDQLLDPLLDNTTVDRVREFWVNWVRGRGPLPSFRVGSTPYGILPVTSLARWQSRRDAGPVTRFLPGLLRRLLPYWTAGVSSVPHVNRGDPDQALIDILTEDASAREVWVRPLVGNDAADNLARFLEVPWNSRLASTGASFDSLKQLLGGGPLVPRLLGSVFHADSGRFRFPLVADVLTETSSLAFNYLQWIRTAAPGDLRRQRVPDGVTRPTALLYRLARHALLLEYRKAGLNLLDRFGLLEVAERREPELVGIVPGTEARQTFWQRLDAPVAGVTGAATLGDHLQQATVATTPEVSHLAEHVAALQMLESLPTAELDRLFTETLDCCAHRLDAWITALATERLEQLRSAQPTGIHLGAFGWVENLRPVPQRQLSNGGFIHAPSMTQAAAAAVMRNAYLSHSGPGQERYAFDVSSERVRRARWLVSAAQQGQSLRALLGYQFERGLHERQLEKYIEPFRVLYPLPERDETSAGGAVQGLSPRDVVDGMKLREEAAAARIPFGTNPDLPSTNPDLAGVTAELERLSETFDALSDAFMGESVFQLVQSKTMGASASLDMQAQGVRPPDPEFVRAPRGGIPLTHRVALVLGGDPMPDAWSGIGMTARGEAEPHLDRWLASIIGDPAKVQCRVRFPDPTPADPNNLATVPVSLAQLGLRPMDLIALAPSAATSESAITLDAATTAVLDSGSGLDRRIVMAATANAPAPAQYEILYAPEPGWIAAGVKSIPQILELLRAVQEVIGKSRPLRPADLLVSEDDPTTSGADELASEYAQRAADAVMRLQQLRANIDTELTALPAIASLRAAVVNALSYSPTQFPPLPLADQSAERQRLMGIAQAMVVDLRAREIVAGAVSTPSAKISAVFGGGFPFLPRFTPGDVTDLANALAFGPSLGATDAIKSRWLQQLRRVRQPLAAWGRVELFTNCLGGSLGAFALAQLPHDANASWVGLPFAPNKAPDARKTSIALFGPAVPAATDPWVGLWIDEWNETIPSPTESTAIGFHYDDPGAEAAQTVLLAVCPTNAATWDVQSLEATLMETFDLAQVRAVHADVPASIGVPGVPDLAPLLPAIYLAANPDDDTVSTDFTNTRVRQAAVVAAVE